jgi:hypothetical protein
MINADIADVLSSRTAAGFSATTWMHLPRRAEKADAPILGASALSGSADPYSRDYLRTGRDLSRLDAERGYRQAWMSQRIKGRLLAKFYASTDRRLILCCGGRDQMGDSSNLLLPRWIGLRTVRSSWLSEFGRVRQASSAFRLIPTVKYWNLGA